MKQKTLFYCTECGNETAKWSGQCPACGAWNTLVEAPAQAKSGKAAAAASKHGSGKPKLLSELDTQEEIRFTTGVGELDRVLGGGAVRGSVVLVGGAPGVGKSTLLLQLCGLVGGSERVLYVTGEESRRQLKMRAQRLGVSEGEIYVLAETQLAEIEAQIEAVQPTVVIVDSIQTMFDTEIAAAPGSVSQVRECTMSIMRLAKADGFTAFVVGHINKEGSIAGPKVLEHMVDAVLYFEGERNLSYRILRAIKNRYGSTNEIGVFEMGDSGLDEVSNPSQAMLEGRPENVSGTCVACVIEGSRPILAEVQALVSKSGYPSPRRMATGFDYNRLALLLAVLEKRCGYFFGTLDAYINVVGGLRLDEPAADLPVALALVSNLTDKPIPEDLIAFGEVGLAGELRAVNRVQMRIKEARRLGFKRCLLPKSSLSAINFDPGIELIGVSSLSQALSAALAGA